MPFTPFHFGIALLLLVVLPFLDPLSLIIASVAPDVEGVVALFILPSAGLPLHGPLHSFLGASVLGIMVGGGSYLLWKLLELTDVFKDHPISRLTLAKSVISGLLGSISHVILDAPLYSEMTPFLPVSGNLLLNVVPAYFPYLICLLSFIGGLAVILIRLRSQTLSGT
ncbi:MAG: hypothetical protein ACFFE8_15750 [Candidatus Heimdallarchaeota archaeon]